ncbi:MAG: hypothetical protein WC788_01490 [Candidatus Paceibacterota bacterium]|jgi:hypothetical protein
MKKKIETEISFAEMIEALKETKGEVESPVSIFDSNTLFSAERYDRITRMLGSISSLRRNETIDLSAENHNRPRIISSLSVENLWFSIPISVGSETEMQKAFFENVAFKAWNGMETFIVKTKSHGSFDRLPMLRFPIGRDEIEIGIMKDSDGHSLCVSRGMNLPSKDADPFISLRDMRNFICMLEKVFFTEGSIQTDSTREDPEKRLIRISRIDAKITYCLDNVQKTKICQIDMKKGATLLSFQ